MSDIDRFFSKVQKTDDCWEWLGAKDRKGYGRFSVGRSKNPDGSRRNSMVGAHRFSFEHFNGPIPDADGYHGMCVLHRCDNPSCVNPDHLFFGTNEDNVHDMDAKGRRVNAQVKGSAHKNSKLAEGDVDRIVEKIRGRVPQAAIAKEFNVCLATVNHIATGRLWSHHTGISKP